MKWNEHLIKEIKVWHSILDEKLVILIFKKTYTLSLTWNSKGESLGKNYTCLLQKSLWAVLQFLNKC